MKILCFTTSYRRPYYIYNIINNILNQSYKNIEYCININLDKLQDIDIYKNFLLDFIDDKRLKIIFNKNDHQQINYTKAITGFGHSNYDLFLKIDDDDIYKKHYIEKSIELFNKSSCDIISYVSNSHINNNYLKNSKINSIGVWKPDTESEIQFGMPSTFIFNKKACDIIQNIDIKTSNSIHKFEDGAWKTFWRKNKLKSLVIENQDVFVYNIHNNNVSSKFLLNPEITLIENSHAAIVYCEHQYWTSYLYLNKRNNRIYNINNNDHGSYSIKLNKLNIIWDDWGAEEYTKEYISDSIYKYIKNKK